MPKVREKSELEYLRSENKRLKSENRHLKKQVNLKSKREYLYKDLEDKEHDAVLAEEQSRHEHEAAMNALKCPQCQNGEVSTLEVGIFQITICNSCKHRTRKKIGQIQ